VVEAEQGFMPVSAIIEKKELIYEILLLEDELQHPLHHYILKIF
jgi:hypothetical protein